MGKYAESLWEEILFLTNRVLITQSAGIIDGCCDRGVLFYIIYIDNQFNQ
ncbi:Uncharacterized protein YR821_1745 [Yersinia ruckeri]|uniref:Uncharacterized protein n=1 Tax=Yersinia ruckeri TaxID=29486 RepID=A0A0A8VHW2_YERRU|nr:hypothetical protein yruck0001_12700 [Yersinia ruckeri ATCC 29473]QTD76667.1 Uncharacterized protein YR821_1745 [Yersinia ruckeri]CEK27564.1 hypothetical protein CSF007_9055 [Yersinia ruckeri]